MRNSIFSGRLAARIFAALTASVVAFQLALALGAPWGELAMGGKFPGVFPPPMRLAAVAQAAILTLAALVVLSRAGDLLPSWRPVSKRLVWVVVALLVPAAFLNLVTPSGPERMIWAPIAALMLLSAIRVATAPPR